MSAPRTTTTCRDCGNQIPESLLADALCVRCRYPTKKAAENLDGDGNPIPTFFEIAADVHAFNQYNPDAGAIESACDDGSENALHWLRVGLLVALEGGRADGIASRTAALATILELYPTAADAAARLGLDRRAVERAAEIIRAELNAQAKTSNPIANTDDFPPAQN